MVLQQYQVPVQLAVHAQSLFSDSHAISPFNKMITPRKKWKEDEINLLQNSDAPSLSPTAKSPLNINATARQMYDKQQSMRRYSRPKFRNERKSMWSVEEKKIFEDSGIIDIERVSIEDIERLLPPAITSCKTIHQIRSHIAYVKKQRRMPKP